jgi:hypothetical protein
MLPGAFSALENECNHEWVHKYDWPGFIIMASMLAVHLLEFVIKQIYAANRTSPSPSVLKSANEKGIMPVDLERGRSGHAGHGCAASSRVMGSESADMKKVTVAILEIGIAAHSVIIGKSSYILTVPRCRTRSRFGITIPNPPGRNLLPSTIRGNRPRIHNLPSRIL